MYNLLWEENFMGKFLETIGVIDGYDIISIGKLKAKNDNLFV